MLSKLSPSQAPSPAGSGVPQATPSQDGSLFGAWGTAWGDFTSRFDTLFKADAPNTSDEILREWMASPSSMRDLTPEQLAETQNSIVSQTQLGLIFQQLD